MKIIKIFFFLVLIATHLDAQKTDSLAKERQSLDSMTAAIRSAFEQGDAVAAAKLHSPDIVKYFGGTNVVKGRAALERDLAKWFRNSTVEFVDNTVESTIFAGETAIQTCLFAIKTTPKYGGKSSTDRGRSMVVYIRDKSSPTGWLSLREMTQGAPPLHKKY
jgi:ketosteroid isomerase-like protein